MRRTLLLIILLVSGCVGSVHNVPEQYRPLERVQGSPLRSNSAITTIGRTAYVNDLGEWLTAHPPGSPKYHALLLHEREHTLRQEAYGLRAWLVQYLADTDFMWAEERVGWYAQIQAYRKAGLTVNPEGIAKLLSSYRNIAGRMVAYEDALAWVRDVLSGRWQP